MDIDKIGDLIKSRFDITKVYAKYRSCLKDAEQGKVVTRFPPEPSGFMHIGHVKAMFLNYHYAKMFEGKMILRFDDTNPAKEKQEFVDNIVNDIKTLGVVPDKVSYTSDYFDLIADKCRWMIQNGHAYCDNTPVEQMRQERFDGIASKCRDQSPAENLKIFEDMVKGEEYARAYCVRAKLSVNAANKCLRDPTMYRYKNEHHQRTGDKWKVYPTYDFACPLVDAHEGVTHALRSNEYVDRNDQYKWFQKTLGMGVSKIYDFSRLCFVSTIISKRNLTWFVANNLVDGWDDPRFPTVQGIMRRGIILPTLIEFMLDQGPTKNYNLMEWDKIWAINKNYLENMAGKFTAVSTEKTCVLTLSNVSDQLEVETVPTHPKNADLGSRQLHKKNKLFLEFDDAENINEGEKVTLMKFGNILIKKKTKNEDTGAWTLDGDFLPEDKDWKSTQKITWLAADEKLLAKVNLVEYDHLIDCPKIEEDQKLEDHINKISKIVTQVWADPCVKNLQVGTFVQFERRCFARLDKKYMDSESQLCMDFIFVPDGKSKGMSNIKNKVDAAKFAKGGEIKEQAHAPEDIPQEGAKPKKEKKVDEAIKAQKMKEKAEKMEQEKAGKGAKEVAAESQGKPETTLSQ